MPKLPALFVALAALAPTVHANPAPIDLNRMLSPREPGTYIGNTIQSATQRANDLVLTAMGFLDRPYRLGGMSAETGFDCSGFVHAMYQQSIGLKLPRRAAEQAAATRKIDKTELRPGDLVFFNTMRRAHSHVGIYVGEGKFIHAPRTGARVRVESMNVSYWRKRFDGARRVALPEDSRAPTGATMQLAALRADALPASVEEAATTGTALADLTTAAAATAAPRSAAQALHEPAAALTALAAPKAVIQRASPAPRQVRLGGTAARQKAEGKPVKVQLASGKAPSRAAKSASAAASGKAAKTARIAKTTKTTKRTAKAATKAGPAGRKAPVTADATARKPRRV